MYLILVVLMQDSLDKICLRQTFQEIWTVKVMFHKSIHFYKNFLKISLNNSNAFKINNQMDLILYLRPFARYFFLKSIIF